MSLLTRSERCLRCFHKQPSCYCRAIRAFRPGIRFVILIQYREARKHVATGRLAHLCLEGSELIEGYDYTHDPRVNEILADPKLFPMVLYPGAGAVNLSRLPVPERATLFPADREPVIFVVDGTWTTARKTMQRSANLRGLPQLCFDPPHPSRIRLRRQPKPYCFSTVEAIHHTLELMGTGTARPHDHLLEIFDLMVERQISLTKGQPRSLKRAPRTSPTPPPPPQP